MSLFRRFLRQSPIRHQPIRKPLRFEPLETREVPHGISLLAIPDTDFSADKALFVPVTASASSLEADVSFGVTSSNPTVTATLLTGGRTVKLTVTGKDSNNQAFTGEMTLRLFESTAPLATNNIVQLVKNGYYVGKEFHRVVNDFVIQGGSPNGDGQGGSNLISDVKDEFNPKITFQSRGLMAMANAGDDNNNAQFFITDPTIVSNGSEVPAPLDRRSQFLNFNHTIVGILTSGFDTYQKIMDVPKVLGSDGAISSPVNDVTITNAQILDLDPLNAVVRIEAPAGFLGSSTITVTGTEGDSQSKTFTVTAVADTVNDRPFLGAIGDISTAKNTTATFTLPFVELDAGDLSTFAVGRIVNTNNGPVITTMDPTQGTASVDANGKVTFTPATGFTGAVTLVVGVRDGQDRIGSTLGLTDARNFDTDKITINVGAAVVQNTPPTISDITDRSTASGTAVGPISFTIGDAETAPADLILSVDSSDTTLVPLSNIVLGGSGANRTITVTPAAGLSGTASITVTVKDSNTGAALLESDSFALTVGTSPPPTSPPPTSPPPTSPPPTSPPPAVSLATNKSSIGIGRDVLLTASFAGLGSVQFLNGSTVLATVPLVDNKAFLTTSFASPGTQNLTAKLISSSSTASDSSPVTLTTTSGSTPVVITAEGTQGGTKATLTIKNQDGSTRFTINPYGTFSGVVRTKVGDVNGDGQLDAIAVPGFGGGPHIVAYDGATGKLIYQKMIFEDFFRGGLSVDVGDAKGLGYDQILVGAGNTGGPRVTLLDASQDKVLLNYFAYDSSNRGGVSVAISDLRGNGVANIITGAGTGLPPNVNVYNPFNVVGFETPSKFGTFVAGSATDTTGIRVGAGKLSNDATPRRPVLVGPLNQSETAALSQSFDPIAKGVFVG